MLPCWALHWLFSLSEALKGDNDCWDSTAKAAVAYLSIAVEERKLTRLLCPGMCWSEMHEVSNGQLAPDQFSNETSVLHLKSQ